jgi:hypothetical protein
MLSCRLFLVYSFHSVTPVSSLGNNPFALWLAGSDWRNYVAWEKMAVGQAFVEEMKTGENTQVR